MKFYRMTLFLFLIFILSLGAVCAQDINQCVENSNGLEMVDSDILSTEPDNTFNDLNNLINTSTQNEINIEKDYEFNNETDTDYAKGIDITKNNLVINGNNHTIDASGKSKIFQITGSNITISNLIFKNANDSGITVNGGQFKTNNVTFNNCSSDYGGAVFIYNGVYNSVNDKFINNYASSGGNAVCVSYSYVTIDNASFENDKTINWGLIYAEDEAQVEISNTTFKDLNSRYATAIYATEIERLSLKKSKFINLFANATAGAIGLKELSTVQIEDCEFINVTSSRNGGAIFADINGLSKTSTGKVSISNSSFVNCSSEFGGAILQLGGYLYIYDSNFTDNYAICDGGAIYCSNATSTLSNAQFENNYAYINSISKYDGGAIYFDNGIINVESSKFINNSISDIFLYDSLYTIQNNQFENNNISIVSYFDRKGSSQKDLDSSKISLNNVYYDTFISENGIVLNLTNIKLNASTSDVYFNLADLGYASSVKNQGSMSSCWAFGAASALESAFLRQANFTADVSENNIKSAGLRYSIYGATGTVETTNLYTSSGYYVSWLGVVPKQYDEYDELGKISSLIYTEDNYHVQNVLFVSLDDINSIKQALIDYGELSIGVSASYFKNATFYNNTTYGLYINDKSVRSDHIVTIVGWNDTFSKNNFNTPPSGDGAWIIKNSWGEEWGDDGYFYISYYDLPMKTSFATGYILNNTEPYTSIYQYDFMGSFDYITSTNTISYCNVYTAEDDELISAVGTYFDDKNIAYKINIVVNDEIVYTQSGKSLFSGYETIKLDKQVSVNKDENFTIQVISTQMPYIEDVRLHYKKGVSFATAGDTTYWLSDAGQAACLKAYTVKNPINVSNIVKYYSNDIVYTFNINKSNENVSVEFNGVKSNYTSDENGTVIMNLGKLAVGNYPVTIYYANNTIISQILVKTTIDVNDEYSVQIAYNTELEYTAIFYDGDGNLLINTQVTAKLDGQTISGARTMSDGKLSITVYEGNSIGTHTLYFLNSNTGESATIKIVIVSRFASSSNVNMYYFDGSKFNVVVRGNDGNPAAKNAVVTIKLNKVTYKVKTNANGKISFKIPKTVKPGKYTMSVTYMGQSIKKTVKVKQNLKSKKTVKVKKSAKKLVLKATLKNGKKALKSKKISFKLNGKKYTGKTNKKGVAKVTVKKKFIKKLKKGKKYAVKVTYLKNTIKTKVKVK